MRIHLVDGTYELYRAHFSKRPDHFDPRGRDRKATVGLVQSMLGLLADKEERVTHIAVAFDNPIRSFRNELFDGYKSDEGVPPELRSQFDPVEAAVSALGIVVWSMDRFEADDALATGACRFKARGQVRLLTPDKDLGQCLDGKRVVQVDRMRKKIIEEKDFRARRGIRPESLADYLALTGDSADGIPGLPGFGEKTAGRLLARYAHIEAIPDDAERWDVDIRGKARLAETLSRRRRDAILYRTLATLVTDVPLEESLDGLKWGGVPKKKYLAWCRAVGAQQLAERPHRFESDPL